MLNRTTLSALLITATFSSTLFSASIYKLSMNNESPKWAYSHIPNKASLRGTAIKQNSYWVTGSANSVFVSQDGGTTWQDKSISAELKMDFRDIELFDNKTAIVMAAGTGELSTLYKTTDAGNSWQLLYQNTDKLGFFNSIAFWNDKRGLLMGDPVDGYYVIKKTNDGGKTFRRIAKNKIPKILTKESAFAASGNSIIVGNNGKAWIATGGFSASVYVSDDYGETWQRNSVPLYKNTQTSGGYGVALNHLEQPFVIGGDYLQRRQKYPNMAKLANGQWQSIKTGSTGLRTTMSCQDSICLASGKTATDISYDAGNTWQALVSAQPNENAKDSRGFYSLASDDNVFLAAGAEGKIGVLSLKELGPNQVTKERK
ncbi:WD40/YVTN/BNR-like repeat-containing protein [Colwellia sp. 75C3]|uniref:WD40/YVTN/BNR-like repeat-containing protein n=1 Tax=Colwellia sp. 75C3 TaxID=888425 RepID=UPI0012FF089B|nr:oxidoreductase [Colwellia sp. 75C3]